jgi:hypothetical protein
LVTQSPTTWLRYVRQKYLKKSCYCKIYFLKQLIYTAWCGTTKGITFKDLLSGLVLLTRGHQDEKCRCNFILFFCIISFSMF